MLYRHSSFRLVIGAIALVCLFASPAHAQSGSSVLFLPMLGANTSSSTAAATPATPEIDDVEQEMIRLTNEQRLAAGCQPFEVSPKLSSAASSHSEDMAKNDFLSHNSSNGSSFIDRYAQVGYNWQAAAENVAAGQQTPEQVIKAWMNSPGHRANILNCKLKEIGVGHAYNSDSQSDYYWTQDFGTPR